MQLNWDIFCRVVDNYGDIGVCWRLARQLAGEYGKRVRLWVDDLKSLALLCPAVDCSRADQWCDGIEIRHWTDDFTIDRIGDVVIEAFACELPQACIEAMTASQPKPCWINLEYLTAEPWAESCHGMASPHPSLPLVKYFYFPGFSARSGGLLREKHIAFRDAGLPRNDAAGIDVSLFCYETAPVAELLAALAASDQPVRLHVAAGKALDAVARQLGGDGPWQLGKLAVTPLAFMPQNDYDRLLAKCAINFVRGEDSFVRAQWARRPFVWQIYRQDEDAHLVKLEAFLARYTAGFGSAAPLVATLFRAWNQGGDLSSAWKNFIAHHGEIDAANRQWTEKLIENDDLASSLVKFCASKV